MSTHWGLAILFGVSLLCVGGSPGGDDAAAKTELKKLEGVWQITSGEKDGKSIDSIKRDKVTVSRDNFTVHHDGKVEFTATIKLYPNKKPKAVDLRITSEKHKGKTVLGIYELNGDDLKFCITEAGAKSRPTDFSAKPGTDYLAVVLKREKK